MGKHGIGMFSSGRNKFLYYVYVVSSARLAVAYSLPDLPEGSHLAVWHFREY